MQSVTQILAAIVEVPAATFYDILKWEKILGLKALISLDKLLHNVQKNVLVKSLSSTLFNFQVESE
jgi:hypothetical protein